MCQSMTLSPVWEALIILSVCPLLGGLPLIAWITYAFTRINLARVGTGNVSVSAAFYHGGRLVGILAVLSEAFKGIAAVLLAHTLFPEIPAWELIALIALVIGRYSFAKGAGTTNVVWGCIVHDPEVSGLVFLIGGISFTLLRERRQGRTAILILFPVIMLMLYPHAVGRVIAAMILSAVLALIYRSIPDDLDLPAEQGVSNSQPVFRFFRGDKAIVCLDQPLDAQKVGQKAATLSQLKRWGYPVPMGWVLPPGDDLEALVEFLQPSPAQPLVVRSSAVGEDSEESSAAGQYQTILNVTSKEALQDAIIRVIASYDNSTAVQYRRDRQLTDATMAVLIQHQIRGAFSGVAFSRDPISQQGDAVVIEGLPGEATQVVSGQVTPEQYRVYIPNTHTSQEEEITAYEVEGTGDLPPALIREVAYLTRQLEARYHGIPQDVEWSYDGQTLWILQSRPITTLQPIWTRKIAAEVIPGLIRPLTWSINRPLTCGVWGDIFTLVLGDRAQGLDFNETATLHYSHAYFNATLLGQIFRRMGLPAESLEFLTRGAKFSKPPLLSTLRNIPGLLRLLRRELSLEKDFERDYQQHFAPALVELPHLPIGQPIPITLLEKVDLILDLLRRGTYYSILAPLSLAVRQGMLRVQDNELDNTQTPEVSSLRSLRELATDARHLLPVEEITPETSILFATLAEMPDGESILEGFYQWLNQYGYLSQVATDIAVPRWKEDPRTVRELFTQFLFDPPPPAELLPPQRFAAQLVQRRLDLKGQVTEVYSQLMAQLRWSFVGLENLWLLSGLLSESGDIFFLEFEEVRRLVADTDPTLKEQLPRLIEQRREQLRQDQLLTTVAAVVYGNAPRMSNFNTGNRSTSQRQLRGIGASPGQVEGLVRVIRSLQGISGIDKGTILVVPYTDSGWAPLLARAGGLIAEVGGRLSHGAIVAREYGIPAVMDIHDATQLLRDGQRVRIDGQLGIVEIL